MVDSRGVVRGACTMCHCAEYHRDSPRQRCSECGHPPGKHKYVVKIPEEVAATDTGHHHRRGGSDSHLTKIAGDETTGRRVYTSSGRHYVKAREDHSVRNKETSSQIGARKRERYFAGELLTAREKSQLPTCSSHFLQSATNLSSMLRSAPSYSYSSNLLQHESRYTYPSSSAASSYNHPTKSTTSYNHPTSLTQSATSYNHPTSSTQITTGYSRPSTSSQSATSYNHPTSYSHPTSSFQIAASSSHHSSSSQPVTSYNQPTYNHPTNYRHPTRSSHHSSSSQHATSYNLPSYNHPMSYSHPTSSSLNTTSYSLSWEHKNTQFRPKCKARNCSNEVYHEPGFGDFSYCSPQCRDDDLIQDYRTKLVSNLSKF